MALLIGYGAGAINPYLAFESIEDLIAEDMHGLGAIDPAKAMRNYIKACGKGVLKVMSKIGISTVASYTGRPDLRGRRPRRRARRAVLHRHGQPPRRHRAPRDRHRGRGPPRRGPPRPPRGAGPPQARARRRVPVAPRGRGPPVQPGDRLQAAARHAGQALRHLPAVLPARRRPVQAAGHVARAVRPPLGPSVDPARGGRAGGGDRQAVLHRGHELRLDLDGGPRDAGHRHEPHRRQVEHRRGRRGPRAAARPQPPLVDQAGGVRAASASRRST